MPSLDLVIGAIGAVYIGNAGDSAKMKRFAEFRVAGCPIAERLEKTYCDLIEDEEQDGYLVTEFSLTFLEGDMVRRVLRRLSVTESNLNSPHGDQKYDMLLVFPIAELKESFLFEDVYPSSVMETTYSKGGPVAKRITFNKRQSNATVAPYQQDTVAALKAILGSPRSPV
jgi:hypothetical protein